MNGRIGKVLTPKEMGAIAAQIIEETSPLVDTSIQVTREEYVQRWKKVSGNLRPHH
ncbi:MAG: hypothetical protein QW231_02785 [Candidatus Bathyarchaeia archaeon]